MKVIIKSSNTRKNKGEKNMKVIKKLVIGCVAVVGVFYLLVFVTAWI